MSFSTNGERATVGCDRPNYERQAASLDKEIAVFTEAEQVLGNLLQSDQAYRLERVRSPIELYGAVVFMVKELHIRYDRVIKQIEKES